MSTPHPRKGDTVETRHGLGTVVSSQLDGRVRFVMVDLINDGVMTFVESQVKVIA